eukprot:24319_1
MGSCCTKNHNKGKTRFTLQQNGQLFTYKSLPKIPKSMQNIIDNNMWKEFQNLCYTATFEQQTQSKCSFSWFSIYLTIYGIVLFFLALILPIYFPLYDDCISEMGVDDVMLIIGFIAFFIGCICILINDSITRSKYDTEVRNNLNKSLPKFNHKYRTK